MSIKYAMLGLLAEQPNHGYAIHAAFEERLGDFWELNYGQVYQVLHLLEGEGLIAGQSQRRGKRPRRRVHHTEGARCAAAVAHEACVERTTVPR
jgi:DNA-binding PadR family transcriptional regulator